MMTEPTHKWIVICVAIVVVGAMTITAIACNLNGMIFAGAVGIICLLAGVEIKAVIDFYKETKK